MCVKADLVIKNGKVYTVLFDGSEKRGEAVAVADGKIIAFGSNDEISQYIGDDTEIADAEGKTVLPGFCDAHLHASFSGSTLFACNLFNLRENGERASVAEKCQKALKKYIDENPDKKIIKGCGWDMLDFTGRLPDKSVLDSVCPDRPVVLESYCQHHMWLNSKALEMAGIDKYTAAPRNGLIYKDREGNPTGLLSEFTAMDIVREKLPDYDYTVEEYKQILMLYQEKYAGPYGVTMIFDALSTANAKQAFEELAKEEKLTVRVRDNEYADPAKPISQFQKFIDSRGQNDVGDLYVKNTVKFFMESTVPDVYFTEPYRPIALKVMKKPKGYRGFPYWEKEELNEIMPMLIDAGFQLHTHAMGDGAVKHTIDAYEYAQNRTGKKTRNVIAHLMYVQPEDFVRMGKNNIIACAQPTWMAMKKSDRRLLDLSLGKKRVDEFYPYKRFLNEGVVVSAGTDFPVTPPPDPFIEMEHALTRKLCSAVKGSERKKNRILAPKKHSEQDIVKIKDVIQSRTISGAYQCFAEDITGSIEVGKSADLIILDSDIEKIRIEQIHKIKVRSTYFKGRLVYSADRQQNLRDTKL